ncbi:MAG: phosphoribosylformylglycinamidine synthase subunit PurS [Bryobacterales bacterium]|nr:phosphoribosylformylglycinamidine synthase subunit PurS [Bryobacterales bacterium]
MRFRVHVSLKPSVLDPQGQTICSSLRSHGHGSIAAVRQGKFFDIDVDPAGGADPKAEVEQIAREVLTNPVIEEFRLEQL